MTTKNRLLSGGLLAFLLASCISTTSGPPEPEQDDANAALQYYQLGTRYYKAGSFELARDRLLHALTFDPKMANAHSVLALTYQELDVPRLAVDHFELAIRYAPRDIDVRNSYAVFLCRLGEFDEAREQFERAIKLPNNDDSELMMTNAGVCMVQQPNLTEAENFFRRALAEKPNYAEALLQMASLKQRTGDALSARAFLQRYLSSNPPSAGVLWLAIQIENDNGDARASTDYSNRLMSEFPTSPEARSLMETG